jgi:asparagine synthase (glutamine-hydrolysing)
MESFMCGWVNAQFTDELAAAARTAMANACAPTPDAGVQINWNASGTVISRGGRVPVAQHRQGPLLVALMGQTTWKSDELAGIARALVGAAAAARAYEVHGPDCLERCTTLRAGDRRRHAFGTLAIDRGDSNAVLAPAAGSCLGTNRQRSPRPAIVGDSMQGICCLYCENVRHPARSARRISCFGSGIVAGDGKSTDYWQLDYEAARGESDAALREEFHRLLRESVARAATTEDAGTFLSGGTDSSTVTGLLTQLRGQAVDTYSIGFEAEGFDEMDYARITSRHLPAGRTSTIPPGVAEVPMIAAPRAICLRVGGATTAVHGWRNRMVGAVAGDGGFEPFGATPVTPVFEVRVLPQARRGLLSRCLQRRLPAPAPLRKARL